MSRIDRFDFIDATWGDSPPMLAVADILTHWALLKDTQGNKVFQSVVRNADEPREVMAADMPQLRFSVNETRYANPTIQFHPTEGFATLDFWVLYYAGDVLAHEQQRERLARLMLRSLSDPGNGYLAANTSTVYSQPDPNTAGFGFQPRYVVWDFLAPQTVSVNHVARPPFILATGMKATRITLQIQFTNVNEVFS